MRRRNHRHSSLPEICRVLSMIALLTTGGFAGAVMSGAHVAYAKGGGDGGGGGGNGGGGGEGRGGGNGNGNGNGNGGGGASAGNGSGIGAGTGGTGSGAGAGTGGSGGVGVAGGIGGTGSGAGGARTGGESRDPSIGAGEQESDDLLTRVARTIGLTELFAAARPAPAPQSAAVAALTTSLPPVSHIGAPKPARPARIAPAHRETQAFQFEVGATVFPNTGGALTTEAVDGVDVVTVDAQHRWVIHPAAFFEPHEGAQFDRRSVERLWPLEVGKTVHFIETLGSQRWLHVMSVNRVETVEVPAGVFRAFVVERTVTSMAPGPRPVVAYTYWYAPDAGAIVKSSVKNGSKKPLTDEADVLGYPLATPSTASVGSAD